jgi:hypothetical protein
MHPSVIYTLVLSLRLITISALPTITPPTEPEAAPQHPVSDEGSYICCPDEVELSNPDFVPLGCRRCTAGDPVPPSDVLIEHPFTRPVPLPSEGGEIERAEVEGGEAARGEVAGSDIERVEIEGVEVVEAEAEAVFSFAGRAANGLANWKMNWKQRKVEQLTGIEQLNMQMERTQALFEMAEGGGAGGDQGEGEAVFGK